MSREAQIGLAVGAVLLVAFVALGLGLAGTTTTTSSQSGSIPDPPADGSAGLVFDLRTFGGLSVFGLQLSAPTREAHVGLVVPPECVAQDSAGVESLLSDGRCADIAVRGELSGGGTTSAGQRLVFVRVDVPRRCFETLAIGDRWPSSADVCAD